MCGIAGVIDKNNVGINHNKFNKMIDIIEHRGPDDRGVFYENNIALGHRRLSIIDLSSDGHQPFEYKDRYVLVFNGEIYNYIELREELVQEGYSFKTKTDTEVLIASYDCWKEQCVERFNGMWSFAIYDRKEKNVFCSRDRFGVKPFYYTEQEGFFLFGSEIKQFFEILEQPPHANYNCLVRFIHSGILDYSEETMFDKIYQLKGGYNLLYDLKTNQYSVVQYHRIMDIKEEKIPYKKACEEFYNKFYDSINLRLRADVPIGYCLSGGLDSSAIVCMADKILKEKKVNIEQHTISSCSENKAYDEQEYIDEVVEQTGVNSHKVFPDGGKLFEKLDEIIWHMDEPFGSTSIYAQWNVFRTAKENNLKVMLDGQGADEQLAGYTPFYRVLFCDCLKKFKFLTFIREWKQYKLLRAGTEKYLKTVSLKFLFACAYMPDKLLKKLSGKGGKTTFLTDKYADQVKSSSFDIRNTKQYFLDSLYQGMSSLLHYEDRDSMAFSIESRVPFLDYQLAETLFAMPIRYKIRSGVTKAVLRDGLKGVLPDKIRTRYSKLGFVTPEDQWIKENKQMYRSELENACNLLTEIIDKDAIMKWFDEGDVIRRGDSTLFRIICAGRWIRVFRVETN